MHFGIDIRHKVRVEYRAVKKADEIETAYTGLISKVSEEIATPSKTF